MDPMLATATAALPHGEGWAFEFKWDGIRALVDVGGHGVQLTSRRGNDISAGYPELVAQAAEVGDALIDGEIVAFVDGRPSFGRLQTRMHLRASKDVARMAVDAPVTFVAFDLLRRFGVELTSRPYTERRATLERFAEEHEGWTVSPSFDDATATELVAREHGLEGVVAKRLDSTYEPGRRTEHWRKLRFVRAGDFAVIGWEASPDHPGTLSSLILAVAGEDGLRFAGKVGSGISGRMSSTIRGRLTSRVSSAVADVPRSIGGRHVYWVEPDLVVEVEFASWTDDRRLRHPVFHGIREDKTVQEATGDG